MVNSREINLLGCLLDDYRMKVTEDKQRKYRESAEIFKIIRESLSDAKFPERIESKEAIPINFSIDGRKYDKNYFLVVCPERNPRANQKPYVAIALDDY